MKKFRILICLAIATAVFAGLQTTALAAIAVSDNDNVSSHVSSHVTSHVSSHVASRVTSDMIQPYGNESAAGNNVTGNAVNPRTGMESLAVPGVAALLAAATAAVALTGKKK